MRTYAGANALASKASHMERKIREQSTFRFGPCFRLSMAKVGFSARAGILSPPRRNYFFTPRTASFAALATRNLTTVLAAIPLSQPGTLSGLARLLSFTRLVL